MDYGFLTLIPPIIAIAFAIAFRKVALALLIGIFSGELILCGWNPITAVNELVNQILNVCADTGNLKIRVIFGDEKRKPPGNGRFIFDDKYVYHNFSFICERNFLHMF